MHAQDLFINNGSNRETVKAVSEGLPELDVVPPLALIVETIDSVNTSTFVVSSQQEEVLGILDLVGKEQAHSLERLFASVHVVTQEQVVGIRGEASVFKQSQ